MGKAKPPAFQGYVKDYRRKLQWPYFKHPATAHLWEWCLLRANYKPCRVFHAGQVVELEAGQFITGLKAAAKETGLSVKQVRTSRKHLLRESAVKWAAHGAHLFSIVTVCNWQRYQSDNGPGGTPRGERGAHEGHTRGTRGATDKKVKKEKKVKKTTPPRKQRGRLPEPEGFKRWWTAYPNPKKPRRRMNRKNCLRVWEREGCEEQTETILAALESDKAGWDDPQFIPLAMTWLNAGGWDEPTEDPQATHAQKQKDWLALCQAFDRLPESERDYWNSKAGEDRTRAPHLWDKAGRPKGR